MCVHRQEKYYSKLCFSVLEPKELHQEGVFPSSRRKQEEGWHWAAVSMGETATLSLPLEAPLNPLPF